MDDKQRSKLFNEKLSQEINDNKQVCLWMSFCDTDKPKDSQFLGVIITKALGLAHAVDKTHAMGINPGGEIKSCEIEANEIKPEHFDRLLSKQDLKDVGYLR